MKIEKKISLLLLCAAMLTMAACGKTHGTDEEETRQAVGFVPQSEANLVKATTPLSAFHSDFGVWGIARHATQNDIILWESNAMSEVKQQGNTKVYVPVSDAYWFSGYTYDFIAVAPWDLAKDISSINKGTVSGTDNLSFTYSLADKYAAGAYKFDPMAAVAESTVNTTAASWTSQQNITFWHLLSQININVTFVDGEGKQVDSGSVSEIRMNGIDTNVSYTLGFNSNNSLSADCAEASEPEETTIVINTLPSTIHVVPQDITDFEVFVDFKLGGVAYDDFKLNLDIQTEDNPNGKNPAEYEYNGRYDWNIKIGPKGTISFKVVEVEEWGSVDVNEDYLEII